MSSFLRSIASLALMGQAMSAPVVYRDTKSRYTSSPEIDRIRAKRKIKNRISKKSRKSNRSK